MLQPFIQKTVFSPDDLEKVLTLKEKELEAFLVNLKFEEQLELVLSLPWDKRAQVILASSYSEGLVQNLPAVELFFTLKASSLDLAVELISYSGPSQLQFFLDFDVWYKDRIRPERVATWIILLFSAGESKVLEWLSLVDWDFLIALLQKFIKVYKRPDDVDLLEAYDYLPEYTLDDVYFIEFKNEQLEFYFRRIIEIIRAEWPETYFSLMESLIWEIPLEVEERAFRFRNGRLADEGIPDYYIALEIYSPLHPQALPKIDPPILALPLAEENSLPIISYLLPYGDTQPLFILQVLNFIQNPSSQKRIKQELAWLATKVILIDYPVIDEIESVKKGIYKMWSLLNLGLEYLTQGNLESAIQLLENHFIEDIFRIGASALREIRKLALSLYNNREFDSILLKYLDYPYKGYLEGVAAKKLNHIKLFQPNKIGTDQEWIEFSRLEELRLVRRILEEIAYIGSLIDKGLGPVSEWIKEVSKPYRNLDFNFLTLSSVILTNLVNYYYQGEFQFKALPKRAWKKVFSQITENIDGKTYLKDSIKEEIWRNFKGLAQKVYYLDEELLNSFLNFVINRFEEEFRYADPIDPPDPKYQTLILIDLSQ